MKDLMPPHRHHTKVRGDVFNVETLDRNLLQIEPGAESLAPPGDHHRANRIVRLRAIKRAKKLLQTLKPKRIVELWRDEGDGRDPVGYLVFNPIVNLLGHFLLPFLRHANYRLQIYQLQIVTNDIKLGSLRQGSLLSWQ